MESEAEHQSQTREALSLLQSLRAGQPPGDPASGLATGASQRRGPWSGWDQLRANRARRPRAPRGLVTRVRVVELVRRCGGDAPQAEEGPVARAAAEPTQEARRSLRAGARQDRRGGRRLQGPLRVRSDRRDHAAHARRAPARERPPGRPTVALPAARRPGGGRGGRREGARRRRRAGRWRRSSSSSP